ncbi:MAG: c-type cytochrome biogenesis protein CcmI [Aliivibrio sp.]|uniref:c-type cytochrome biogenesis protein CcmI n=1 Tax=Aliivibrio sp. TaxID=1872443 RepID=UPI001A519813|nr:c-type cytochrome biogenesis protein CcmI [Aliivibrio sp.]
MMLFWVSTLILIAIGAVIIIVPLWQAKSTDEDAQRDQLNKAFYKDRLAELEEESSEGLVSNQEEMIKELKQSLLDDIPQSKSSTITDSSNARAFIVPALLVFVAVTYALYFKFGNLDKVEQWQDVAQRLPALSQKLMAPEGVELTEKEMVEIILSLRTKLHDQPNDAMGWLLLGRIGMANRDAETASGAMEKAYRLEPGNPDIQLGYAQAMMLSGDEDQANRARDMLRVVVSKDSTNLRALSLLAFDSFERGDYRGAIVAWSTMKKAIGPDDNRYEMLNRSIERAHSRMNPEKVVAGKSVTVTIELSDAVQLPKQGVVIVSIHSADGARMPVAAVRLPIGQFPLTVTLDDSNSMIAERKLTSLTELMVRTRIDLDGNVSTKAGDWYGESEAVAFGEPVTVLINKQY